MSLTALGRAGEPEDVTDGVGLLASKQAWQVTGLLLRAGGEWRMHH